MNNFSERIQTLAESALLKVITEGSWIMPDYANRVRIPADLMLDVYNMIDKDKIKKALKARIESELAERIMNHIAAEMATDVKSIMSVPERREALRAIARNHVDSIVKL